MFIGIQMRKKLGEPLLKTVFITMYAFCNPFIVIVLHFQVGYGNMKPVKMLQFFAYLSASRNHKQMWIPANWARLFLTVCLLNALIMYLRYIRFRFIESHWTGKMWLTNR